MLTSKKNSKPARPEFKRRCFRYDNTAEVSTAHITNEDGRLITDTGAPNLEYIIAGSFGSMFQLPDCVEEHAEWVARAARYGFSDAFVSLGLELARAGFRYVYFDGEGPIYPELPTYDW